MIFQRAILIFDTYLNTDEEDVYYLSFSSDPQKELLLNMNKQNQLL
jgi:hypothetical protein